MPQYLAPGVYVEEIPGPKPIEAVGTATGAFVGLAEKGPIGQAKSITNWTQFVETFGGFIPTGYLAYAVNQFFAEGGTRCYVVRTCHYDYSGPSVSPTAGTGTITLQDTNAAPAETLLINALTPGSWSDHLWIEIAKAKKDPATNTKFRLVVRYKGREVEAFEELNKDNVVGNVNGKSRYITVAHAGTSILAPVRSAAVLKDRTTTAVETLAVTAMSPDLTLEVADGSTTSATTFKLTIKQGGSTVETFDNLTVDNVKNKVNGISQFILVENLGSPTAAPDNRPLNTTTAVTLSFFALTGGDDGLADGVKLKDSATAPANTLLVNAFRDSVQVKIDNATSGSAKFKLTVLVNGAVMETFDEQVMDTVEDTINGSSQYLEVTKMGAARPASIASTAVPTGLMDMDFIGDEATKNGIHAFDPVDDINILAIPDRPGDREVILMAYTYCQNRRDCFFVADPPLGLDVQTVQAFKEGTGDLYAGNAFNSSYAALYYPWVSVSDPLTGGAKFVPPSGAVAGTYSSTDVLRGVHKAPAGTIDGYLNSAVGIERIITKGEQEILNPDHVNVIRSFPGAGIVIWGARTLSADPEWRYVNVRRLLLYIEESIDKGSQWVVFEPNDRGLWARLKRDLTAFLNIVWKSGALFGSSPEEAFFVKIDDENNPPEMRDAGRLNIDIGVAPVKPAEFVIFRISQKTAGAK